MEFRYQLVLEFEVEKLEDFDCVVALEELLIDALTSGEVDGHDAGQGIVNLFILTDDPHRTFDEAMRILESSEPGTSAAGFRDLEEESYCRLWPVGDTSQYTLR